MELDRSKSFTEVARALQVSIKGISGWAKEYRERGLQSFRINPGKKQGQEYQVEAISSRMIEAEFMQTPRAGQ